MQSFGIGFQSEHVSHFISWSPLLVVHDSTLPVCKQRVWLFHILFPPYIRLSMTSCCCVSDSLFPSQRINMSNVVLLLGTWKVCLATAQCASTVCVCVRGHHTPASIQFACGECYIGGSLGVALVVFGLRPRLKHTHQLPVSVTSHSNVSESAAVVQGADHNKTLPHSTSTGIRLQQYFTTHDQTTTILYHTAPLRGPDQNNTLPHSSHDTQ